MSKTGYETMPFNWKDISACYLTCSGLGWIPQSVTASLAKPHFVLKQMHGVS